MVEIFKTNVRNKFDSNYIIAIIQRQYPNYKINFDLEDCDKILRVEGSLNLSQKKSLNASIV